MCSGDASFVNCADSSLYSTKELAVAARTMTLYHEQDLVLLSFVIAFDQCPHQNSFITLTLRVSLDLGSYRWHYDTTCIRSKQAIISTTNELHHLIHWLLLQDKRFAAIILTNWKIQNDMLLNIARKFKGMNLASFIARKYELRLFSPVRRIHILISRPIPWWHFKSWILKQY